MPVPTSINDLSTTASSNSPPGSEGPADGDNYFRAHASFIATLRDQLNGTANTGTIRNATFSGTMAGAASWSGVQDFDADPTGRITGNVYTPTGTAGTLVSAVTPAEAQYMRVGPTVTVSGRTSVTYTNGGSAFFYLSLPVASNLGANSDCAGTASLYGQNSAGTVEADTTGDRAIIQLIAPSAGTYQVVYTYTYQVI